MQRLAGKIVFITGIGGGMGRQAAITFAREGAKVVGCDLFEEPANETVEIVRKAGGEITNFAPVNLSDAEATKQWIQQALDVYGGFRLAQAASD